MPPCSSLSPEPLQLTQLCKCLTINVMRGASVLGYGVVDCRLMRGVLAWLIQRKKH